MGNGEKRQKVNFKHAVEMGLAEKKMTKGELATATARSNSTITNNLNNGSPTSRVMSEFFEAIGAKVLIEYANGMQVELNFE